MKKLTTFLLVFFTVNLVFANGSVSFKVYDGKLKATIEMEDNEHVAMTENFLFLLVDSKHYDFIFSGYPEPDETIDEGFSYYSGKLVLEGDLILKEDVPKGDYEIDVTLGYQTCTDEGICYIPMEITRTILVEQSSNIFIFVIAAALLVILLLVAIRKKRINDK